MKRFLIITLVILLLWGCAAPTPPQTDPTTEPTSEPTTAPTAEPTTEPTTEPTMEPTTEPTTAPTEPPVYIYEGAQVDLLEEKDLYWEDRLPEAQVEFVMVHFMSAVVEHPDDPYNMTYLRSIFEDYEISVHYIIGRDGTIYCYVPENVTAYHAGRGTYGDERYTNKMNHYSVGIEIAAIGSKADMVDYLTGWEYDNLEVDVGYTEAQYESLIALVRDICLRNDVPMDRQHIVGHDEYGPGKTDPGELFDWERLINGIQDSE